MNSSENLKINDTKPDYYKRIKQFREMRNYTQEYMASVLNLSQRAYSSIENGQTQLTVDRLYEIAQTLEIPVVDIIGMENKNIYNNNFNNHAINNKASLIYNQGNFEEYKMLYERIVKGKEEEIIALKEMISELKSNTK